MNPLGGMPLDYGMGIIYKLLGAIVWPSHKNMLKYDVGEYGESDWTEF